MKYRPEIDGLRAVAVATVIAFHFDLLPGGYLGVDIFFVISGYLITSIIWHNLRGETFSFRNFWGRRVRRIAPALFVVVFVTLIAGHFLLDGEPRQQMPLQAIAATLSWSNMLTWWTIGDYWSADAKSNPFLHCWSLSIEEQFYLVLPLTLVVVHRLARTRVELVIAFAMVASLITHFCLHAFVDAESAFYLLPPRMWELLMGSLLAIQAPRERHNSKAPMAGLAFVAVSFFVPGESPIPNLIACIGTVLFLSQRSNLLTWPALRYIGRISYSAYLWHWPVIVLAASVTPYRHVLLLTLITLFLSMASYHLVETPFRRGFRGSQYITVGTGMAGLLLAWLLVTPPGPVDPVEGQDQTVYAMADPDQQWRSCKDYESILAGRGGFELAQFPDAPLIVLTGSSYARQFSIPLEQYSKEHRLSAMSMAIDSVEITLLQNQPWSRIRPRQQAADFNQARLKWIDQHQPDVALVAGSWVGESRFGDGTMQTLREQLAILADSSRLVLVLAQTPKCVVSGSGVRVQARYHMPLDADPDVQVANRRLEQIIQDMNRPELVYVDVNDLFLNDDGTVRYYEGETMLYSNPDHLSDAGEQLAFSERIAPLLASMRNQGEGD